MQESIENETVNLHMVILNYQLVYKICVGFFTREMIRLSGLFNTRCHVIVNKLGNCIKV